jgi:hypothetical protein
MAHGAKPPLCAHVALQSKLSSQAHGASSSRLIGTNFQQKKRTNMF